MIVVVMGVCGCGKSSVGRAIAARQGWTFIEGDERHPDANKAKMAAGIPLQDEDRWPWLDRIAMEAHQEAGAGRSVVIACSALKKVYRDRLRQAGPAVRFVHLAGDADTIRDRMRARTDHYMPASLLDSQLAILEPPGQDEASHEFDIARPIAEITDAVLASIGRMTGNDGTHCAG
jgi:gluconokinase